jgi:hypothetical protein
MKRIEKWISPTFALLQRLLKTPNDAGCVTAVRDCNNYCTRFLSGPEGEFPGYNLCLPQLGNHLRTYNEPLIKVTAPNDAALRLRSNRQPMHSARLNRLIRSPKRLSRK